MNSRNPYAAIAAGLVVAGVVAGSAITATVINAQGIKTVNYTPQEKTTLETLDSAFTRLAQSIGPSVVHINVTKHLSNNNLNQIIPPGFENFRIFRQPGPQTVHGIGTGVIIRSDGYILTNDHVVGDADEVEVVFQDGRTISGKVTRDYASDIALVKVDRTNLPAARLGDSAHVQPGQFAVALGTPYGLENSVTVGHISALKRKSVISDGQGSGRFYANMIQTDAAINPGNSGGPLINIEGEVIGINTAIEGNASGGSMGIGFAIPINNAKLIVNQLMSKGKVTRAFLGIQPQDLTPNELEHYNIQHGARVLSENSNSPAADAGIEVGDIITDFAGQPIDSELSLREAIAAQSPGTSVKITLVRGGKVMNVNAKLSTPPKQMTRDNGSVDNSETSTNKLGATVSSLSADLKSQGHMPSKLRGVIISQVLPGSAAQEVGLQEGDVIEKADGKRVNSPSDLDQILQGMHSGDSLDLVVWHRVSDTDASEVLITVHLR